MWYSDTICVYQLQRKSHLVQSWINWIGEKKGGKLEPYPKQEWISLKVGCRLILLQVFTKGLIHVNNVRFANGFLHSPWTKGNLEFDKLDRVINLFKLISTSRLELNLSKSTIVGIIITNF